MLTRTDRGVDGLWDVHRTPALRDYVAQVWDRRHYIRYVSTGELRSRQMNTALGNLWHLLNPLLQMGVFFLVFGVLLGVDRGVDNFMVFLAVGIFVFGFTQRCTTAGANSIVNNRGLLMALRFPRAMLPATSTITETLATVGPVVVIYVVAILTGETPSLRWLVLVPIMGLQMMFNFGAALVAARITNSVRDVTQVLPLFFRLLFYGSGIIFNPASYASEGAAQLVFDLNPVFQVISLCRWSIMGGEFEPMYLGLFLLWSIGLMTVGMVVFRRGETRYGRE